MALSPEQLEIIAVVERDGRVLTAAEVALCFDQARALGVLQDRKPQSWPDGFTCGVHAAALRRA